MEAISCLVPELRSEMRNGCRMQLLEKTQCFYVAKVNFNSCKKAACKSAKAVGKDRGYKSGGLHCVYGQKNNRTRSGSW